MKQILAVLLCCFFFSSKSQQFNNTYNGSNGAQGIQDYGIVTQASSGQASIGAEGNGDIYANLNLVL